MDDLLLSFYGDDFTGSTDTMEVCTWAGLRSVLFLEPPTASDLDEFPGIRVVGVAGISRSLATAELDAELRPVFAAMGRLGAPAFHYKTCSTFDSSPETGSIGRAIEVGVERFRPEWIPLVVGAPKLRRYVAFTNLFARVDEETYRLDRHPTMSRHPVTPMRESDLRRILAEQTDLPVAAMTLYQLDQPPADRRSYLQGLLRETEQPVVAFDTVTGAHLPVVGELIWERTGPVPPFLVGSSGMEYALCEHWTRCGIASGVSRAEEIGEVEPFLVVSGSASPPTAAQIDWAEAHGYTVFPLNLPELASAAPEAAMAAVVASAVERLRQGDPVVLHTARGPDDPAIERARNAFRARGISNPGAAVGGILGRLTRQILEEHPLPRICVAGGDTSGQVGRALGIRALEAVLPLAPGGPVCRAHMAADAVVPQLEIALKGGQVGAPEYFQQVRAGRLDIAGSGEIPLARPSPAHAGEGGCPRATGVWKDPATG